MIKVYNDMSRKKEDFVPVKKGVVGMYVCGPTIYDYGHLGHGRSAVNFDVIRRYFIYREFDVNYVFNYTDIEDKMIKRANEEKISVRQLAKKFSKIYDEDYTELGIMKPTIKPLATEVIPEMIEMIKILEKKGYVYVIEGDGVYYDISKFREYGKLSGQKTKELKAGARVEKDERKKNPGDFVLWKFEKPGEPFWKSPWGKGRPGWHIECSAMSKKFVGPTLDIHGGGRDLIFPHHEDEIAQSEAANNAEFAKYWMHNGFIQIKDEKMSKSLGNFFTLREVFKKYSGREIRYSFLTTHYKKPLNFSEELFEQARNSLERIDNFVAELKTKEGKDNPEVEKIINSAKKKFEESMDNDFDTPGAFASIFDIIKDINKIEIGKKDAKKIIEFLKKIDSVLGIISFEKKEIPEEVKNMAYERQSAREKKDWALADKIRKDIEKKGYGIKDSEKGFEIKRIS